MSETTPSIQELLNAPELKEQIIKDFKLWMNTEKDSEYIGFGNEVGLLERLRADVLR